MYLMQRCLDWTNWCLQGRCPLFKAVLEFIIPCPGSHVNQRSECRRQGTDQCTTLKLIPACSCSGHVGENSGMCLCWLTSFHTLPLSHDSLAEALWRNGELTHHGGFFFFFFCSVSIFILWNIWIIFLNNQNLPKMTFFKDRWLGLFQFSNDVISRKSHILVLCRDFFFSFKVTIEHV